MPQFRLADLDLAWTGTDDTTPPSHTIAVGRDPLGNTRVFLWHGDQPDDNQYVGSLLITDRATFAYGARGGYVTSGASGDQKSMLNRLADIYDPDQN